MAHPPRPLPNPFRSRPPTTPSWRSDKPGIACCDDFTVRVWATGHVPPLLPDSAHIHRARADRSAFGLLQHAPNRPSVKELVQVNPSQGPTSGVRRCLTPVSYTHLTLPTIYSV